MRRVILQMMVSLDGLFEGPNREIDWHSVDEEFNEYAIDLLNNADMLLFGRVTYKLMADYWTSPSAIADDPVIAGKMNSVAKIVFSKTLDKASWNNTRLVKDNVAGEILKLKKEPGPKDSFGAKDLVIFGSSDLALTFIHHSLIDEYRIIVNPVVLGAGKTLFRGIKERLDLQLLNTRIFKSGNVMLYYQPNKK